MFIEPSWLSFGDIGFLLLGLENSITLVVDRVLVRERNECPFGWFGGSTIAPFTLYLSSLYEMLPATLSRQLFILVLKFEGSWSYAFAILFFSTGKSNWRISLF